jgi:hypothetical protein
MPPPPAAPPARFSNRTRLIVGGVGFLVLAALMFWAIARNRTPDLDRPATLESVGPAGSGGPGELPAASPYSGLEIAGIRLFYDDRDRAQARVIVINHGENEMNDLALTVALRPRQSAVTTPPLGRFSVKIPSLAPGASREVQVPLEAFGTLVSFPAWRDIRADLE